MEKKKITLGTLAGGVLEEMFEDAMQEVVTNIADPNTEAKKVREINIKIKLLPTENREAVQYEASCNSKLATSKPYGSFLFVSKTKEESGLYESDSKQEEIEFLKLTNEN